MFFVIGTEWKKRVIVFNFAHKSHVESVRFCWGAKIAIKLIFTVDLIPCYILLAHFPLLKPFHTCVCFLCSFLFVQLSCDQCSNYICFTAICFSCHFNYHKKIKSKYEREILVGFYLSNGIWSDIMYTLWLFQLNFCVSTDCFIYRELNKFTLLFVIAS